MYKIRLVQQCVILFKTANMDRVLIGLQSTGCLGTIQKVINELGHVACILEEEPVSRVGEQVQLCFDML